jgi:hypothetical protein
LCDFEDEVGESSADTSDDSESEHDLAFTFHVGVLDSQNVGELVCLSQYNRGLHTERSDTHVQHQRRRELTILLLS